MKEGGHRVAEGDVDVTKKKNKREGRKERGTSRDGFIRERVMDGL